MNGNEKIIASILAAAQQSAAETEAQAKEQAAARIAEEEALLAKQTQDVFEMLKVQNERREHTARSSADLSVRNAKLRCRREEIDRTVEKTLEYLCALPDDEYFSLLSSLIAAHRENQSGILCVNSKDQGRMPAGFADSFDLKTDDAPAAIDGGCVLKYGDIEIDLSFESLLNERRDAVEDAICRELWGA